MSKQFEELLNQLNAEQEAQDALIKSLPQDSQDDDKIQAAAAEGEAGADDGTVTEENEEDEKLDENGEPMAKSLTLEGGEEAIDATDLLKAMQADIDTHGDVLAKAMPQVLKLMQGQSQMIQQQGTLIKSMQSRMDALAGQGRGRKAVITVSEKPVTGEDPMVKSQQDGMSPQEFMLKANNAFDKKLITGTQFTTIDVCLREGQAIDPELIRKIVSA